MASPILITGGTGTLGRLVVPRIREALGDVRVLTRGAREPANGVEFMTGDLATGAGVERAVVGVKTIMHLAGSAKGDEDKARTLVRAASKAGVAHLVFISVVGADRPDMFSYFTSKLASEKVIGDSGVPWTTLRATQFHDLVLMLAQGLSKLPVAPVPSGFRVQPVDAGDVADRLVELALGEPSGLVPDIGGPAIYRLDDLVRSYLRASRKRRPIMPLRLPGKAARSFRAGGNLTPAHATGRRTWEEFLAERVH